MFRQFIETALNTTNNTPNKILPKNTMKIKDCKL